MREYIYTNWLTIDDNQIGKYIWQGEWYKSETYAQHVWYLHTHEHIDGEIRYIDEGDLDAEVIVLLHGTPTSSWLWRNIVSWLVADGYRVIAPDMLWYGMSAKPIWRENYTIQAQTMRIVDLLSSLDIQKYSLAWHDQGSLRMRDLVSRYSSQVENLIVFNSIYDRDWFQAPSIYGKQNLFTKTVSTLRWSRVLWRVLWYMSFGGGVVKSDTINQDILEWYLTPLLDGARRTNYYFISDFDTVYEFLDTLPSLLSDKDIPSLLVRWGQDTILDVNQTKRIQSILDTDSKDIHIYPNAKHFIQEEYPHDILELLSEFLARTQ